MMQRGMQQGQKARHHGGHIEEQPRRSACRHAHTHTRAHTFRDIHTHKHTRQHTFCTHTHACAQRPRTGATQRTHAHAYSDRTERHQGPHSLDSGCHARRRDVCLEVQKHVQSSRQQVREPRAWRKCWGCGQPNVCLRPAIPPA